MSKFSLTQLPSLGPGAVQTVSLQVTLSHPPGGRLPLLSARPAVFQCLTGQAAAYLADDCQLTSDVRTRRLRSTDTAMCVVQRSNNTFGDRCFASAGPRLWNTLPAHLRQYDSLGQFKRLLKTHLNWFLRPRRSVTFLLGAPCINLLTYLLTVADSLLTTVVTHQLQVERWTGKVRRPETVCSTTVPHNEHAVVCVDGNNGLCDVR